MSEPAIQFKPSTERYDETVTQERKTGLSFPELKKRFDPTQKPPTEAVTNAQTIAVPSVVRETAELMYSCLLPYDISGKTALFVIGATGAGKSSLCNWLVGHKLRVQSEEIEDDFGSTVSHELVTDFVGEGRRFDISGENASKTFVPNVYEMASQNRLLIDFPGFFDTSAFDVRVGMDLGFRRLLNAFDGRARIIALVAVQNFDTSCARAGSGRSQLQKMIRLVPTSSASVPQRGEGSRFCVGISRCDRFFAANPGQLWKSMQAEVVALDDVMAGAIWNANKDMLELKGFQTPQAFLSNLDDNFPIARSLQSDCMDYADMQNLEKYLQTNVFTSHLLAKVMKKLGLEGYDDANKQIQPDGDENKSRQLLTEGLIQRAERQSERITRFADWIMASSKMLVENKQMALQSVDDNFRWMEEQKQPRLTKVLAHVEKVMMQRILAMGNLLHDELKNDMKILIAKEIIIGDDKQKVEVAILESSKKFDTLAVLQGHQSREDYTREILLGGAAVVAVGGGVAVGTAAVSAAAFAVAGLMTGGVSCLIVGGIATIAGVYHKLEADKKEEAAKQQAAREQVSNKIAKMQIEALAKYYDVGRVAIEHGNKLTALIDHMSALESS